jgi:predicted DNA-binding protein
MSVTEISPELESEFDAVANLTGEPKDELVREALLSYLEDFHLARTAEERLKDIGERTSLADIGKEFGLAD